MATSKDPVQGNDNLGDSSLERELLLKHKVYRTKTLIGI